MGLLDFLVDDPEYNVESHPLSVARKMYEDANVDFP